MNVPLQLTMAITPAHRNEYLFSDHYLDNLLPQDPRWEAALAETGAFLGWLRGHYAEEQNQLADYNEDQLEEHWFKPILRRLGHAFEGQASIPGLNRGVKRPDYVFFPDEATRQVAVSTQSTEGYVADALAVGEVKRWDTPLSKKEKGGGASFEAQNPSWQIDYYVRATGLEWGVLSNGRVWRLVHKDTSERLSIYYEVDLVDLMRQGDAGTMRYFTLFFRQAAFRPDAHGRVFLADVLAESKAYAVALEEDVEANVYQALERLMQGFLDLPANGLGTGDLRRIYENSLYLLYRLLFILYGETRGLLPLHLTSYRDNYSLDHVKREIAEPRTPPAPMTTIYWGRLRQLFQIINGDNVELNRHLGVPRYNGGLFDPELHPFLEQYAVGDRALVEAIDLLSRRMTEAGREFVDYRTLGVRHLGSIYEGLLEYQPRYASEPVVAVRENKGERWVKAAEATEGARVIEQHGAGQVYLETDRGERKATGSYYTPQYIVEYIVENTLGPLVEEARERVKARAKGAKGKAARAAAEQSLVDEILGLKILDPAMGSGHFLVEATEYLARALATDPYVETEVPVEEDLTHWKRRVVERCIYGVDRNPLAVELAKLSLWLATVAEDKPLSFLDHHLQCGDSLIGGRVADLGAVPPVALTKKALREREAQYTAGVRQANLFETRLVERLPVVMGRILEITEVESDSYETVQAKEAADQAVRQLKAPFQAVANLWVSAYFGNEFMQGEYDEALGLIGQPDELSALPAMQRAQKVAQERNFFHWELAFPEVFYNRNGQPLHETAGFDAVVGNPPYVSNWELTSHDSALPAILERFYPEVVSGHWDLYVLFSYRALSLTSLSGGYHSFIVPSSLATEKYGVKLRKYMLTQSRVVTLVHFGQHLVFEDVARQYLIYVVSPGLPDGNVSRIVEYEHGQFRVALSIPQEQFLGFSNYSLRVALSHFDLVLKSEIQQVSVQLGCLCCVNVGVVAHSRVGSPVIFKKDNAISYQDGPGRKKYIEGGDISRYEVDWKGLFLDYEAKRELFHRPKFRELFESPKIMIRRVSGAGNTILSCYDEERYYTNDNVIHALPWTPQVQELQSPGDYEICVRVSSYDLQYVAAILNSRLLSYYFASFLATDTLQSSYTGVYPEDVRKLPVRRIVFTTSADKRQQLVQEAKAKAEEAVAALSASGAVSSDSPLERAILVRTAAPVMEFVSERLTAEPEQADVVHDLLAYLAGQMIEMHKQKQLRVETFWLDLEGVVEQAVFGALRNKGKQERMLWKTAVACRPFVGEDSHATRRLDESLGWSEEAFKAFVKALAGKVQGLSDVVGVYRVHSPGYRELVACIAATDWLIDQIVYRLYGLTEEEVAIVEGRPDHE